MLNDFVGPVNLTEIIAIAGFIWAVFSVHGRTDALNQRLDATIADGNQRFDRMMEKIHNIELEIKEIKLYKSKE